MLKTINGFENHTQIESLNTNSSDLDLIAVFQISSSGIQLQNSIEIKLNGETSLVVTPRSRKNHFFLISGHIHKKSTS